MGIRCYIYGINEAEMIRIEGNLEALWKFFTTAEDQMDLDKSWVEINYLLAIFAQEGNLNLNFITKGGKPIPGSDCDYGEAQYFSPPEVKSINDALSLTSSGDLLKTVLAKLDPIMWDRDIIADFLYPLKDFVRSLSSRRKGMLISIR